MFGVIRMVTGHGNKLLLGVRFFFQPRYHTTPGRIFQPLLQFFYRIIAILHKEEPTSYTFHTMPPTPARTRHTGPVPPASSTAASQSGTGSGPRPGPFCCTFIHHGTVPPPSRRTQSGKRQDVEHAGLFGPKAVAAAAGMIPFISRMAHTLPASRDSASLSGVVPVRREITVMNSPPITTAAAAQNRPTRYFSAT